MKPTLAKLKAIKTRALGIAALWHSSVPKTDVEQIVQQFALIRTQLNSSHKELFGDFQSQDYEYYVWDELYYKKGVMKVISQDIDYYIQILEDIQPSIVPLKVTTEGIFFSGEVFDALMKISELVSVAKKEIILVDGYIDEKILQLIKDKAPSAQLKILSKTSVLKGSIKTMVDAFIAQHGGLELKTSEDFHDRFLIIDRTSFYHFGASLKDAGKRGFMFSKIEEPSICNDLIQRIDKEFA